MSIVSATAGLCLFLVGYCAASNAGQRGDDIRSNWPEQTVVGGFRLTPIDAVPWSPIASWIRESAPRSDIYVSQLFRTVFGPAVTPLPPRLRSVSQYVDILLHQSSCQPLAKTPQVFTVVDTSYHQSLPIGPGAAPPQWYGLLGTRVEQTSRGTFIVACFIVHCCAAAIEDEYAGK